MAILKILTAPDLRLRQKSLPIKSVDAKIQNLMDDMLTTMYADRGVGLAAIQIGVAKRIFVLDLQDDDKQKRADKFYPLFLANPEITEASAELIEAEEGCLSVPGEQIMVARPEKIKVTFLDYHNQRQYLAMDGWLARAFQHELDHLDGKLLIDYLSKIKRDTTLRRLTKLKRQSAAN